MPREAESSPPVDAAHIKKPNVAGQFYEADPAALKTHLQRLMQKAAIQPWPSKIVALMVPHAGYPYAGPTAAYGFKAIENQNIKTVILLGPTHYYRFNGVAIWPKGEWQTPLGSIPVDEALAQSIMAKAGFVMEQPPIFDKDHVLEVELPYLQNIFPHFSIVPMIMNRDASAEQVQQLAKALDEAVGKRDDVLLLISSDLAHFHPAAENKKIDMYGLDAVQARDVEKIWREQYAGRMEIDGFKEVIVGLLYAGLRGADKVKLLKYGHSGEVTGDNSSVVGYGSLIFYKGKKTEISAEREETEPLSSKQKRILLHIARAAIQSYVGEGERLKVTEKDARLNEQEGAFVTLSKNGKLRGCIGNILGSGPLYLTVRDMAVAAATQDPRFKPVTKEEIKDLDLEISVLSKPRRVKSAEDIVLGKHGVIISRNGHSGVFLPQVAEETHWSKEEFLSQLCAQKAGLPPTCWKDPETQIAVFTAQVFSEKDTP